MVKARKFSGRNYVDFYGSAELLNKIEKMGADVNKAVEAACRAGAEPVKADLLAFMRKHTRPVSSVSTGETMRSFEPGRAEWSGNFLRYYYGFDIDKGGLPALFLDIGTPKIKPSFFVYYAMQNNLHRIYDLQWKALEESVISQVREFES